VAPPPPLTAVVTALGRRLHDTPAWSPVELATLVSAAGTWRRSANAVAAAAVSARRIALAATRLDAAAAAAAHPAAVTAAAAAAADADARQQVMAGELAAARAAHGRRVAAAAAGASDAATAARLAAAAADAVAAAAAGPAADAQLPGLATAAAAIAAAAAARSDAAAAVATAVERRRPGSPPPTAPSPLPPRTPPPPPTAIADADVRVGMDAVWAAVDVEAARRGVAAAALHGLSPGERLAAGVLYRWARGLPAAPPVAASAVDDDGGATPLPRLGAPLLRVSWVVEMMRAALAASSPAASGNNTGCYCRGWLAGLAARRVVSVLPCCAGGGEAALMLNVGVEALEAASPVAGEERGEGRRDRGGSV